jgi:hypothetical protein
MASKNQYRPSHQKCRHEKMNCHPVSGYGEKPVQVPHDIHLHGNIRGQKKQYKIDRHHSGDPKGSGFTISCAGRSVINADTAFNGKSAH